MGENSYPPEILSGISDPPNTPSLRTTVLHNSSCQGQRATGTRLSKPHGRPPRDSQGSETESHEATEDLPESPHPDPAQPRTGRPGTSSKGRPRSARSRRAMTLPPTGSLPTLPYPHPPPGPSPPPRSPRLLPALPSAWFVTPPPFLSYPLALCPHLPLTFTAFPDPHPGTRFQPLPASYSSLLPQRPPSDCDHS